MRGRKEHLLSVEGLIRPVIDSEGMELVETEFVRDGGQWYLRVYIDKNEGVTLNDCEQVSRQISALMDIENLISEPYILEVSSPGLTRPLKGERDYKRFLGKLIQFFTETPFDGKRKFVGKLVRCEESVATFELQGGRIVTLPLSSITRAHLEITF
ncbi:MAG: ribosome maturation factor RimP [Candidatus Tectomicrobia bacterium]|nr:ribosome maturation factor RimP [Candidatus Tectomicrobia bacterium]